LPGIRGDSRLTPPEIVGVLVGTEQALPVAAQADDGDAEPALRLNAAVAIRRRVAFESSWISCWSISCHGGSTVGKGAIALDAVTTTQLPALC
jgi:hypothetical protein